MNSELKQITVRDFVGKNLLTFIIPAFVFFTFAVLFLFIYNYGTNVLEIEYYVITESVSYRIYLAMWILSLVCVLIQTLVIACLSLVFYAFRRNSIEIWKEGNSRIYSIILTNLLYVLTTFSFIAFLTKLLTSALSLIYIEEIDYSLYTILHDVGDSMDKLNMALLILIIVSLVLLYLLFGFTRGFKMKVTKYILILAIFFIVFLISHVIFDITNQADGLSYGIKYITLFANFSWFTGILFFHRVRTK